ncbi:MAG TPA: glycosyltransferase [Pyrinomonadaceae bacterium]|nr:glycosyltransferase [Pyrinomonadaceae bacterium]
MTPTVSVVIPTYNSAHFLPKALASVQAQQWPALEIIVVDDGSTDGTETVVSGLSGTGDLRFIRQENAGAASARNTGIASAKGEWIAFLDADDVWLPGKLRAQFAELQNQPDAAFSYTDVTLRFASGDQSELECGNVGLPLLTQLVGGNLFATPTVLVRRDCLERVGLFDAQLRTGEDWDLWMRLAAHFEHVRVARPLTVVSVASQPKFPLATLEKCTLRTLERLFSCPRVQRHWPGVASSEGLIYSWHYSVLAKSNLRQGRLVDVCRLACQALLTHPAGLWYLARGRREALDQRVFNAT